MQSLMRETPKTALHRSLAIIKSSTTLDRLTPLIYPEIFNQSRQKAV